MSALLAFPDGWEALLVRVNPRPVRIPDLVDPSQPDESLWMVETWAADDVVISLDEVRRSIVGLVDPDLAERHGPGARELMADVHISLTLWHPRSPYGLGFRCADPPGGMVLTYHGRNYSRDAAGVLTSLGTRDEDWPTPERWRRGQIATRLLGRRMGLL